MKLGIAIVLGFLLGSAGQRQDTPRLEGSAIVIHRDQIEKLLAEKLPGPSIYGGGLVDGERFRVGALRRNAPGEVEIHRDDNDIIYIMTGDATIVTGGTPVELKKVSPKEMTAKSVTGGVSHEVHAGDIVVIPNQLPHWFQHVTAGTDYLVVKTQ
jgi:hypothetical protein